MIEKTVMHGTPGADIPMLAKKVDEIIDVVNAMDRAMPKKEEEDVWPQEGDEVFTIDTDHSLNPISSTRWDSGSWNDEMKRRGNYFRTKEKAQEAYDKILELLKQLK